MDEFNIAGLNESKNEWCARLLNILAPQFIVGLNSIFTESVVICKNNREPLKYLMTFQNYLSRIPNWNNNIVQTECNRIIEASKCKYLDELIIGISCAVIGMCLFNLGISLGLTPLGEQLGGNVVSSFASIQPWQSEGFVEPIFKSSTAGKCLAILFGFILGYGATLAEPALNALGSTVEKITVGAFKKNLLMQAVATGVALGIATGVAKIAFNLELWYLLIPPYAMLLVLTFISSEDFVNFGWDSAGVTTGPVTVPLVLAMGLGISAQVGSIEGFGILSLASVCPILSVLIVGMFVTARRKDKIEKTIIIINSSSIDGEYLVKNFITEFDEDFNVIRNIQSDKIKITSKDKC